MNHLLDDDNDDLAPHRGRDKEITLGTGTVLGIFFALTLICAVFFGFGYTMGRKSNQVVAAAPETESPTSFNNFKPAPGSPAAQPAFLSRKDADAKPSAGTATATPAAVTTKDTPATTATQNAATKTSAAPIDRVAPAAVVPAANAAAATGATMVQVAAVSHQEDAEVLTSALKRRGYTVTAHPDAADRLIHVQIGPFSNRKDAEAMRQKLQGDGYNAILK
jgi:cell division septation protein DedD